MMTFSAITMSFLPCSNSFRLPSLLANWTNLLPSGRGVPAFRSVTTLKSGHGVPAVITMVHCLLGSMAAISVANCW